MTPRRAAALAAVRQLGGGRPVHYSEVARAMGVSVWTAYVLLRELEAAGALARSYALAAATSGQGGRSRILFAPAPAAQPAPEEIGEGLRRAFDQFAGIADEATAARTFLASALAGARGDLGFQLGFWLARLEAAGRNAQEGARGVLESGGLPAAQLRTLAAMGLGSALARLAGARLAGRMTRAAGAFGQLVDDTQRGSETILAGLAEAARRLPGGGQRAPAAAP